MLKLSIAEIAATAFVLDILGRYMFPIATGIIPNTVEIKVYGQSVALFMTDDMIPNIQ